MFSSIVKKARGKLSQREFSSATGIPLGTLRSWEQDRRDPDAASRLLMHLIANNHHDMMQLITEYNKNSIREGTELLAGDLCRVVGKTNSFFAEGDLCTVKSVYDEMLVQVDFDVPVDQRTNNVGTGIMYLLKSDLQLVKAKANV